jgi:hypothetical protein
MTTMRPRPRSRVLRLDAPALDDAIAAAERDAAVIWRGEQIPFGDLPSRIARTDGRDERDGIYAGWIEALEAINPHYQARLAHWREAARATGVDDAAITLAGGRDVEALSLELERLAIASETVYFAALRRYLALIDIEQGDATIADLWHVARGEAWSHWFGPREVERAIAAVRTGAMVPDGSAGWRRVERALAGDAAQGDGAIAEAVRAAHATLVGSPEWLSAELGVASAEIPSLADFLALVRLWRLRHDVARLHYELRLYADPDEIAVNRAYYAGIVGHMIGVQVPEEAYLADVAQPFASARSIRTALLGAQLIEVLEQRFGTTWWRDPAASGVVDGFGEAASVPDALAYLGYDALDWRPVLRQIRTRLIGEMSGYGGPNITTRAGTRKV